MMVILSIVPFGSYGIMPFCIFVLMPRNLPMYLYIQIDAKEYLWEKCTEYVATDEWIYGLLTKP